MKARATTNEKGHLFLILNTKKGELYYMYKKTIKYTDYNGINREEDCYFNLNESELVDLNLEFGGNLQTFVERVSKAKDQKEIIRLFKELIIASYGIKSDDGRRFMKGEDITKAFKETNAYNELFMLLATNEKEAANFINGIVPQNLEEKAKKLEAERKANGVTPINNQ